MSPRKHVARAAVAVCLLNAVAAADVWDMYLTVDNEFAVYAGGQTATTDVLGSGNNYLVSYHFTASDRLPGDWLYVATASDQAGDQGFIGVFRNVTTNLSTVTGSAVWEVFPAGAYAATNPYSPSPWPPSTMPTQTQVDTAIAYATANGLWRPPVAPPGFNNGVAPWGLRPNIPINANWTWHNTGLGPDPSNPLIGGFNHDEFLVFRIRSQPLTFAQNIPGNFEDISTSGTCLNIANDASTVVTTTLGNAVFPAGQIVISDNGGIAFGSVPGQDTLAPTNQQIPSTDAFGGRQSLLAFWDDLDAPLSPCAALRGEGGDVFWKETGGRVIIQWQDRPVYSGTRGAANTVRFQIQIYSNPVQAPGGSLAQIIYDDVNQPGVDGGAHATIAYQNGSGSLNNVVQGFNMAGATSNSAALTVIVNQGTGAVYVPATSSSGNYLLAAFVMICAAVVFTRGRRMVAAV